MHDAVISGHFAKAPETKRKGRRQTGIEAGVILTSAVRITERDKI
jgi:hypothetical protein